MSSVRSKDLEFEKWIPQLLTFHIVVAAISGLGATFLPRMWHVFFTLDVKGDMLSLLDSVIQLYGALLIGQAVLVYTLRSHLFTPLGLSSPHSKNLRFGFCLSYTVVFTLSFLFVVKAQILGVMTLSASVNSLLFLSMASAYGLLTFRSTSKAPARLAL